MTTSPRLARLRPLLPLVLLAACRATDAPPAASAEGPARKLLTLEQTLGQGEKVDFAGELPRIAWAADGVHLEQKDGERTVWIEPVSGAEKEPVEEQKEPREGADDEKAAREELQAALVTAGVPEATAKKARGVQRAPNGALSGTVEGELWWAQGTARKLTEASQGELELEERSPDGRYLACVQANDLVLVDLESGTRTDVTTDGSADVFNGKLDWVYQEELYGRGDFKGFWWSADSRHLALLRLDESQVFDFTVIDHIEAGHFRVKPEVTRYPKVGDPNPVAALGVVDVAAPATPAAERVRWLDLTKYAADEPLVVRVDWAPSGRLLFMVQDRIQTWLELLEADPTTGATRLLLREESQGWVNRPEAPRWLADGSFLWLSERTGQRHLYRYRVDDKILVSTLTSGEWSVGGIDELDEARGLVWFSATKDGAIDANLYRVALDGTGLVRLTSGPGRHSWRWNAARTHFLDRVSSLAEPTRVLLCDGEGQVLRELGRAAIPDLESYATSRWEHLVIPARDGFELDAALLPPVGFDPAKRYPVWLPTYSGPDAPSVSNAWNSSTWNQFLAQNGVMVFQVNVRSASGKGQRVIESCYQQLGVQELADLEDAVDWLVAHRAADPARVGITGGSYGGFMAAYALTHSDRFALGLAASGVYDWRMYDTIYTERYMSTPARNPEGYARSSVVEAAANLKGHLVITHGEMDDNVHLQNAIQLVYALQKAGKDFELMVYPQSRHGLARELREFDRRYTWRLIQEHLLGGG
ncbi:MAG TPA: DPP IV N-terminal domain-containing protein [Planctomycetota bacterium]